VVVASRTQVLFAVAESSDAVSLFAQLRVYRNIRAQTYSHSGKFVIKLGERTCECTNTVNTPGKLIESVNSDSGRKLSGVKCDTR